MNSTHQGLGNVEAMGKDFLGTRVTHYLVFDVLRRCRCWLSVPVLSEGGASRVGHPFPSAFYQPLSHCPVPCQFCHIRMMGALLSCISESSQTYCGAESVVFCFKHQAPLWALASLRLLT